MRKTNEILRLRFEADLGNHKIGRALRVSASAFWKPASIAGRQDPPANPAWVPDWPSVQTELRRKHVTLRLLWKEYKVEYPDGFQYTMLITLLGAAPEPTYSRTGSVSTFVTETSL